ncbi:transglycosylase SLT domain-containing protein [Faunimonas sp. B44]|uniref:transglycosylase SLT domain-containing protein n=1 Tax=Faunimonas sp. B44 TaxID=3461493 RepID=UPI004044975F
MRRRGSALAAAFLVLGVGSAALVMAPVLASSHSEAAPAVKKAGAKAPTQKPKSASASRAAKPAGKPAQSASAAPRATALPRPRPGAVGLAALSAAAADAAVAPAPVIARNAAPSAPYYGFEPDLRLKAALDAVSADDYPRALRLASALPSEFDRRLVTWWVARAPNSGLSAREIRALVDGHADWPDAARMAQRAEEALFRSSPSRGEILAFFAEAPPVTTGAKLAYAGALQAHGEGAKAEAIVRELWRDKKVTRTVAAKIAVNFPDYLTRADHLGRFRQLVLAGRTQDAIDQAQRLGAGYDQFARAVTAVLDRRDEGPTLLKGVSSRFLQDPLYSFAQIRLLRRADKPLAAAQIMLAVDGDEAHLGDGDRWWDERRDLSRQLLDRNMPELAYEVVAGHHAESARDRAEAEFHAGWYALRFLDRPRVAEAHFRKLSEIAGMARTSARAAYWLARAFEAQERHLSARLAYDKAANYGATFYGQLAREKMGLKTTGLERISRPSASDRVGFASNELAKAVRRLAAAGHADRAGIFLRALGSTLDSPGQLSMTATLARRIGQPHTAMAAGKLADSRGIPVAALAPFIGVPAQVKVPNSVDRALVYAVARQESAFNPTARSHVGAQGLMQLMPATAEATARSINMPFALHRLSDPHYNATLGAEHLGDLLGRLRKSYILTFVGYNAGPGRAIRWVANYGDPRGGTVDPVDWIERIPFDETRDYVQKVMENVQVYRSRLGKPLSLTEDLMRGVPVGG